ncbi:oxygen-insensitive NADPH nitroreductase [Thalassolituus sp. LLYu03]|uniref:oxygen-insensitive NADPH nitroreductase n=1 Tax=Thalassolituus sp. LLYu03 TaxID=3421656 RepID=UPI003D2A2FD4
MNDVIRLLRSHRSIRAFADTPVTEEQLQEILLAGQAASTSSFLQVTSVIRVTDAEKRARLVELSGGQKWVGQAPEFLVWCADFYRHQQISPDARLGFTEQLLIGAVDTAIMAQTALVAAESMGLGGLFVGGIRNKPAEVAGLLELPEHVLPLFGMCLGVPAQDPTLRPRLPLPLVLHTNAYNREGDKALLADYDARVHDYYEQRMGADKVMTWSEQISGILAKEARPHMKAFIESQGFAKK